LLRRELRVTGVREPGEVASRAAAPETLGPRRLAVYLP